MEKEYEDSLLTRKFNILGIRITLPNFLELIGGILILSFIVYVVFPTESFGRPRAEWIRFLLITHMGAVVGIPILMFLFGSDDYRFKIGLHTLITATAVVIFTHILEIKNMFNTETSFLTMLSTFVPLFLGLMIAGLGAIFSLYAETHQYFEALILATDAFMGGKFDYRVTNKKILEDKVFSVIASSMNEIMETTEKLVSNLNATKVIIEATETLTASTEEINASSEEVASTSQGMSDVATDQANTVASIAEQLHLLDESITDIINKIKINSAGVSQIALQTNILALNAGIEASRAGDYGRGFAVVAENVRKLSDESKLAAEKIIQVSDEISSNLQLTFNSIRNQIDEISALSEETAASAEEVASVAEEMTASMQELTASTDALFQFAVNAKKYLKHAGLEILLGD